MKLALTVAAVILLFLLLKPVVIEGYYDAKADKEYKDLMMMQLRTIGAGKTIDEKSPPDVMVKVMASWLVGYNNYAKKTGAPQAKLEDAPKMFPEVWLEEYNKSIAKK
jgi:hypothetical protein